MDFDTTIAALVGLAAAMLVWLFARQRQQGPAARQSRREALDTVADWPPDAARVLTVDERHALDLLHRALPGMIVLAQVPLSRFIRVPTRRSYADWLQRVGQLSADLLVCDAGSRVLSVIDIRAARESERSQRRHDRLARVLDAAGIPVQVWREGQLPTMSQVRSQFASLIEQPADLAPAHWPATRLPVAEVEELLAAGDDLDRSMEPVASGFFDDLQTEAALARS